MQVHSFTFNPIQENTYVLADPATRQCALVDPGCSSPAEEEQLLAFLRAEQLTVSAVWLTHCHIDHVLGLAWAERTFGVTPLQHPLDEQTLRQVPLYAAGYGFPTFALPQHTAHLPASGQVPLGDLTLEVRFTPGHSPGHVVYYHAASQQLLGGDVLFRGSVGRTDLPGGDFPTLERSIREQLYDLPDGVTVFPGHGPATTIGAEKRNNPFVRA